MPKENAQKLQPTVVLDLRSHPDTNEERSPDEPGSDRLDHVDIDTNVAISWVR